MSGGVYVMLVRSGGEFATVEDLRRIGVVAYVPAATHWRRRASIKCCPEDKPLLPGYVFVWSANIERDGDLFHEAARFYIRMLSADGQPLELVGRWLESLLVAQVFGALDYTRSRKPKLRVGQLTRIIGGPFIGLVAVVEAMKGGEGGKVRVRITGKFFGGALTLEASKLEAA